MKEARVEKLNADQLLSLAGPNAQRGRAQLVHEIDVGQLQQAERASVARVAAAVLDHARPLLLDVDDDVVTPGAVRSVAGGLLTDQDLPKRISHVKRAFGFSNSVG